MKKKLKSKNWTKEASCILKSLLAKKDVSYEELSYKLKRNGIKMSYGSINNKINRGTFSFIFFIQVMDVLDVKIISLD